jgi:hypothetical protein
VGIGFAIALIAFLPLLVVVLPIFILSSSVITGAALKFAMFVAASFLIYLTAFAVFLRLSLLLPARAVGDLALTFKETWKRTGGNTWRMFWGIAACALLPALTAEIALFGFLGPGVPTSEVFAGRMAVIMTIFVVYYLLTLPIWVSSDGRRVKASPPYAQPRPDALTRSAAGRTRP